MNIEKPQMPEDYRLAMNEYMKQYRETHKEAIINARKKWISKNLEKVKQNNKNNSRSFYEKHKNDLLKTEQCEICKGHYSSKSKKQHLKSKKHQTNERLQNLGENIVF
jgi:hypothetical protein